MKTTNDAVTSETGPVRVEHEGSVSILYLNRPEQGNAWSSELGRAYFSSLKCLATDPATRSIVVTGAGKNFCVGADPTLLRRIADDGEYQTEDDNTAQEIPYYFPVTVGKPIVAAINGACFGIGFQQLLCSDIRFLADDCKLSTAYARRGLIAELGMSWLLPRLVGTGRAMDWMLSARVIRADEALQSGLANRVVPAADLIDEAIAYARMLAEKCSPVSMREIKQQLIQDLTGDLPDAVRRSKVLLEKAYSFPDFNEGVSSWRERREPNFPSLPADKAFLSVETLDDHLSIGGSIDGQ